jgi:hypothetical protein
MADPFVAGVAGDASREQPDFAMSVLPNPVPGGAAISFTLPAGGGVSLTIFDERGAQVRTLADGTRFEAGTHLLFLDAGALPDGYYVARLVAGGRVVARPLVLVR